MRSILLSYEGRVVAELFGLRASRCGDPISVPPGEIYPGEMILAGIRSCIETRWRESGGAEGDRT
ncbi:MAG: hypothetical protein KDI27_14400, partial [Gammaproteobacteria bacterium]|nr:hypothetical protein [Gammaproteobacteria bacterium]